MTHSTTHTILPLLPSLSTSPISTQNPTPTIHLFANLLTPLECSSIIANHQNLTPSNVTAHTIRSREVFEDEELAEKVWERMRGFLEGEEEGRVVDEDGEAWRAVGLNEVWRLCFYCEGGKFSPHQDGCRMESMSRKSFLTVNIYLNTLPTSNGGATRFLPNPPIFPLTPNQILGKAQPEQGTAVVFRDTVWHDGEEVFNEGGEKVEKYLLRTDVMFEREQEWDEERVWRALGKEERGRRCLGVAAGLEDTGLGSEAVEWYKRAFRLWPGLEGEV